MSQEIFDQVKDAEEKANKIIQDAQHQAREMIKDAQASCVKLERDQAQEQRALYQSLIDTAKTRIADELNAESAQNGRLLDAELQKAEGRLDAAADKIVERIVGNGHC